VACGYIESGPDGIYTIDPYSGNVSYWLDGCWPAWSPNSQQLAYVHYTSKQTHPESHIQIRIHDLTTGQERIVFDVLSPRGHIAEMTWSPTGEHLAFAMALEKSEDLTIPLPAQQLYIIDVNGNNLRQLSVDGQHIVSPNFSPDGERILYIDWSAPLSADSDYVQITDLEGHCHQLNPSIPGIRRVTLFPGGEEIAFDTPYGLLVAEVGVAFGNDFWVVGMPCVIPSMIPSSSRKASHCCGRPPGRPTFSPYPSAAATGRARPQRASMGGAVGHRYCWRML
jgi:hypothetical protein